MTPFDDDELTGPRFSAGTHFPQWQLSQFADALANGSTPAAAALKARALPRFAKAMFDQICDDLGEQAR